MHSRAHEQADQAAAHVLRQLGAIDALALQNVQASMQVLIRDSLFGGPPSVQTAIGGNPPDLRFGGKSQTGNFALVDELHHLTGAEATLFARQGDDFIRVSTTVANIDGTSAVNTHLDPSGKVIRFLRRGQHFYGAVEILGTPYMTGYEPMRDKRGVVVGAWFVGYPLSSLTQVGEAISQSAILKHGFVALLDDRGKPLYASKSAVPGIVSVVSGGRPEDWLVDRREFGTWKYSLLTAYPESDVRDAIFPIRVAILLSTLGIATFTIALQYVILVRRVIWPISRLLLQTQAISAGDLTGEASKLTKVIGCGGVDEIGALRAGFHEMMAQLRKRDDELERHRERLEEEVSTRTAELRAVNKQLASAKELAEAASRAKSEFVANMTGDN
jgi:methyl-accepting chemotaxis protein